MNKKLMTIFNDKLSVCITKLKENMTTLVENMMLQITKFFSDCLTAILTPLLMKLETFNNANVDSANVDTAAKAAPKHYWTSRRRRMTLRGGRPMSLSQDSLQDKM